MRAMRMSRWRGWLAGVVVVVAVAPAGCGFGGSGGAEPPVASDGSSSGTVTTSKTTPTSGGFEEARRTGFSIFFEPELNTDVEASPEDDLDANPNGAIVQALEGEEQAEYFRALQGYAAGDLDGANGPSEAAMENACGEVARR